MTPILALTGGGVLTAPKVPFRFRVPVRAATVVTVVSLPTEDYDSMLVTDVIFRTGMNDRTTSDLYVEVVAYDQSGVSRRNTTRFVRNDINPVWNKWLDFGTGSWSHFTVRVRDDDTGRPDHYLSRKETYMLRSFTRRRGVRLNAYRGFIKFNFFFENTSPPDVRPGIGPVGPPGPVGRPN